jgi:hypothetical protein
MLHQYKSATKKWLLPVLLSAASIPVQAGIVGYWRFEEDLGYFSDSGPNGLTLNTSGGTPGATPNAGFPNPIPSTGAPNLQHADFEIDSASAFQLEDHPAFAFQDFTIEAFANLESAASNTLARSVAAQYGFNNTNLAWRLLITGEGSGLGPRNLVLQLSSNGVGSGNVNLDSNFQLQFGIDYYVAAAVDITPSNTTVTFYLKDITNSGELLSASVNGNITALFDSTAPFHIGGSGTSTTDTFFDGSIDEVRLSDLALSASELLIVPEPSVATLLLAGLLFGGARRKRS